MYEAFIFDVKAKVHNSDAFEGHYWTRTVTFFQITQCRPPLASRILNRCGYPH